MTAQAITQEGLDKAFLVAFLLTGDAASAEAAVLQSIEGIDVLESAGKQLLPGTIRGALGKQNVAASTGRPPDPAVPMLPPELQRVLHLPQHPRQCFVLRLLMGLPREAIALLLHAQLEQVDAGTCAAVSALPPLENSDGSGY
jgi:hypothetical protein